MKIESHKDLVKIIALCRKQGVEFIKLNDFEMRLGPPEMTTTSIKRKQQVLLDSNLLYSPDGITADTKIITDELTPDQLLFYSTGDQQ